MNRGSHRPRRLCADSRTGFNEAPIHESGKWQSPPDDQICFCRFNEAPIHESGKCGCPKRRRYASPFRFNEAPIHESGKCQLFRNDRITLVASMRPRFMNRGSGRLRIPTSSESLASMRPRFMNRGSYDFKDFKDNWKQASMRPRFMNRGSSAGPRSGRYRPRGFNEAPIHESGKCAVTPRTSAARCGFNEAPIHESGKFRLERSLGAFRACRFNEAPIHESGKCVSRLTPKTRLPGFNEAPIHESGKSGACAGTAQASGASMRPRFMNRGSSETHRRALVEAALQ